MAGTGHFRAIAIAGGLAMAGCQAGAAKTPATLESDDPETMARLEAVLAEAMGRPIELGYASPTTSPTITVLPPRPLPQVDRNPGLPTRFDIMTEDGRCFVVRQDTGEAYELEGVSCRAARE